MTVSEAITKSGITPSASYTGIETANDFVLAFQIESTQTKESQWIVCADHVKEHSGSLNATTEDAQYIRTGNVTEKTGRLCGISIVGEGDDLMMMTDEGIMIRTPADGIPEYGRGAAGVIIMRVADGASIVNFAVSPAAEEASDETDAPADESAPSGEVENPAEDTAE